jgi:uncharacterized phage protein gp47/JayE
MPFKRPTLPELIERNIADIESRLPSSDARLRRSNLNVIARIHSGVTHGLYGFLEWMSKQLLPDTSEVEFLDRQSSIWNITRKAATKATGSITFTGTNTTVIPVNTTVQRSDGVEFITDVEATITGGVASVAVTAVVAGIDSNTDELSKVSLVTPIAGVNSSVAIDSGGIANGTDTESDDALRIRLLDRIQQPPHGGASFDYTKWALEVAGVTRAWVYEQELGLGTVTVRFVVDDHESSIIPDAAKVTEVQDHIDAVRPVTAAATVVAPVAVELDLTITGLSPATSEVQAAIEAELTDLLRREAEPGGTILISHIREAISVAAGEYDHELTTPSADVTHSTGEIAILGTITWV